MCKRSKKKEKIRDMNKLKSIKTNADYIDYLFSKGYKCIDVTNCLYK